MTIFDQNFQKALAAAEPGKSSPAISEDQVSELYLYAAQTGSDWKQSLVREWEKPRNDLPGDLDRLKKTHGPAWLATFQPNKTRLARIAKLGEDAIKCAFCPTILNYEKSWSPGDEAICSACDTEVTGRKHRPQKSL